MQTKHRWQHIMSTSISSFILMLRSYEVWFSEIASTNRSDKGCLAIGVDIILIF